MLQKRKRDKEQQVKQVPLEQKRAVLTTFIMLFPSLIITLMISYTTTIGMAAVSILLFIFQAILIKNFVDDYYSLSKSQ